MKSWKRAFPYILLNIIISAATTLAVLFWWNAKHPFIAPEFQIPSTPTASSSQSAEATPTLPALDVPLVEISAVIAPGDIDNEAIVIQSLSSQELRLQGWQIVGSGGSVYSFPNLVLKSGEIKIYSGSKPLGQSDSATNLYWQRAEAAWRSHETLTLLDPNGDTRATYKIP